MHAALAHKLAAHYFQIADTASALLLAAEAAEISRRLTENPHPHHRFQQLPALVAHMVYLGELKVRSDDLEGAVRVLNEAVAMSRECLYDRRYLDGWADVTQMHVHGLLWLTTALDGRGDLWPAIESSNDAVRIARELSIRGAHHGTSVLAQALARHALLAVRGGRSAEAQASADEAIQYLESHATEFETHAKSAVAADAHLAMGQALATEDQEASLLHLFRAAENYRRLVELIPHLFPLLTLLNVRVTIGNLLLQSDDRLRNAEFLTELIESHSDALVGQMPAPVRQFLDDIASSDESAWSTELKSRIVLLLQRF
jgi:tetratricopeptide (TPR) repeat protein